jgi:DNA-binding transcriptional regulator YiaG
MTAEQVRAWREACGLTQAQLADLLSLPNRCVDVRTVRKWENAEREPPPYLYRALRDIESHGWS